MPTTASIQLEITRLRNLMQQDLHRFRNKLDRQFVELLDELAGNVHQDFRRTLRRFEVAENGTLARSTANLNLQAQLLLQVQQILSEGLIAIRSEDHPTYLTLLDAAQNASLRVRQGTKIGDLVVRAPDAIKRLDFQAIGTADENVWITLAAYA